MKTKNIKILSRWDTQHWAFRKPNERLKANRTPIVHITNAKRLGSVYSVVGQTLTTFQEAKDAARSAGFNVLRMGAVNAKL